MKNSLSSRLLIYLLFLFLLTSEEVTLIAQIPHLVFRHIGVQNGLSADDIRSIYQDRDGFMWFGAKAGTDKFDGKDFYSYFKYIRDTTQNYLQSTTGIIEDNSGRLWFINDSNGLVVLNKITERSVRFVNRPDDPKSLSNNRVRFIFNDSRNNIWITTSNGGLNRFNAKDSTFFRFQHINGDSSSFPTNNLAYIAEDKQGMLWISSPEGYLIKLDPVTMKFESIRIFTSGSFVYYPVVSPVLYIDREDRIWYSFLDRLYIYNPKSNEKKLLPEISLKASLWKFNFITSILEISPDNFLVTTLNDGLYVLNVKNGQSTHYSFSPGNPFGICSNHLSGAFMSRDSVIWISSFDNGMSIYSKASLRFSRVMNIVSPEYMIQSAYPAYSMIELDDGKIMVGTENNGLYLFDPVSLSNSSIIPELQNTTIYGLFKYEDKIWIAAWFNGLFTYDVTNKKLQRVSNLPGTNSNLGLPDVVRTFVDSKGRFWFGSISRGIVMYDRKKGVNRKFSCDAGNSNTLWSNTIFKIYEDREGIIWIGTASGLNRYDEKSGSMQRISKISESKRVTLDRVVYDIYEDNIKQLWIGTDQSLFKLNKETMKFVPYEFNGESRTIFRIIADESGILWLGTNAGILSYDLKTEKFRDYSLSDDIRYISCYPNSGFITPDQIVYIGSSKGMIRFEPAKMSDDTVPPPVLITNVTVNNIPLDSKLFTVSKGTKPVIRLKSKHNNLEFSFAALHYVNPEANQYKYMLKGFDKDWVKCGNVNRANYMNLPPGNYVFRVIASNSHGYWNLSGAEIQIHIKAPLWSTWLFRVICLLVLMAAALIIYFERIRKLKNRQILLEKTVAKRTQELSDAHKMLKEHHDKLIQQHEEMAAQNDQLSQMSREIIKQNEELEDHRYNLERLIAQRTNELEIALRKAEESDRLKSAFLANMSHEIRTPMNAIVGFANLLKEKNLNEGEKNEFIDIINSNSETLLVLIDDILDLSLIEADQLIIRKEDFNLNEVLDHLYSSFSLMNRNRDVNVRLNNELHELNILLFSDRVRVNQILTNLMSNACKFTTKGFVELGAIRKDDQLVFYVQDSGIGIKPEETELVFERFRKSMEQSDTLYRGTGLGLAICKAMAGLLGATISVESEINVGSTFFLMLPWDKVSFASVPKRLLQQSKPKGKKGDKEILVVEDEKANYLYVKKMLNRMNVSVHWAENGLDAVKLAASGRRYDIILMDIKMPVLDGYEATKKIKAANPKQIVIAITAYARPEDRLHFMNAGFNDYISKPIMPNDFMAVISRYI